MLENFVKNIKENSRVAIYGAGTLGLKIKDFLRDNRPDVKILFYIDSAKTGMQDGLEIINPKETEKYRNDIDIVIVTIRSAIHQLSVIFDFLGIPAVYVTREIDYANRFEKYFDRYEKAVKVFDNDEDRLLYKLLWDVRTGKEPYEKLQDIIYKKYGISKYLPNRNYMYQYNEFTVKDKIKTIFDAGFCDGIQTLPFVKYYKNLNKIYAFEPMYEQFKNDINDKFLKDINLLEIVPLGLWDKVDELAFVKNGRAQSASYVQSVYEHRELAQNDSLIYIKVTTIDQIKKEKNIDKVDFIKMDIEGSELPALKGAKETLKNDRPQLAISIYHSYDDFVDIPMYLKNELEDYDLRLGHYSPTGAETLIVAIPKELNK